MKNRFRIKKLPDPISIREPVSKNYVDKKFNDPSIIKKLIMLTSKIKISIMFILSK